MAWPGRWIDSLRQRGVITRTNVIWIQPNGVPQRTTLGRGGAQPRDDDGSLGYWGRRRKKFQSAMHFLDARIEINGMNKTQRLVHFALKVLYLPIFLPKLLAQIFPRQKCAACGPNPV